MDVTVSGASAQENSRAGAPVYAVPVIASALDDFGSIQGHIASGGTTDDPRPTFIGKAEPGVVVHLYLNGEVLGRATTGGNGEWSFIPKYPLPPGAHEISILHQYPDGHVTGLSEPYVISRDNVAPEKPLVNGVLDDQGRITGAISNESVTDDNRPVIVGTAEPDATLIVYDMGKEVGRVPVDGTGAWSFTPDAPLKDGVHRLEFVAVDRAGNASEESVPFEFQVDTRAERVRILGAEDNAGNDIGTVYSGGATDDATPTLWGSATVGGLVSIYESGMLLGQTTVDVDGSWEFTPDVALSKDVYKFYATVSFDFKGESAPSPSFTLTVKNDAPNARSIEPVPGEESSEHAQVLAGIANTASYAEASAAALAFSPPAIDSVFDGRGSIQGVIENGGFTDDYRAILSGKGEGVFKVHCYSNAATLGTALVGENGEWSFTPRVPLREGINEFSVIYQYANGSVSGISESYVVFVDYLQPAVPLVVDVVDDQGRITGTISNGGVTDDNRPTVVGTTEPNATLIVYDMDNEIGRVQADGAGKWSFTPDAPLKDGLHRLDFVAVDRVGNGSENSGLFEFQVDTRAERIRILGADDNVGNDIGSLYSGSATDDATPTLWGTATVGGLVSIYESGVLLGQTTAEVDGFWEFTPDVALSKDVYKFYATVSFDFKGESAPSSPFTLTIKDDARSARSIEHMQGDEAGEHALVLAGDEQKFAVAELSQILVQVESELFASEVPSSGAADTAASDVGAYHAQSVNADMLRLHDFALEAY